MPLLLAFSLFMAGSACRGIFDTNTPCPPRFFLCLRLDFPGKMNNFAINELLTHLEQWI